MEHKHTALDGKRTRVNVVRLGGSHQVFSCGISVVLYMAYARAKRLLTRTGDIDDLSTLVELGRVSQSEKDTAGALAM